jgi:hypothetical protein
MNKNTLMLVLGAAALYFFVLKKKPAPIARPVLRSAPTDSMAAATMPGAVQGLITDGARQAEVASMQGFFY